ncbi:MAG: hypothetical protein ACP5UH_00350 [Candidatus Micrarchaeia archaeon]
MFGGKQSSSAAGSKQEKGYSIVLTEKDKRILYLSVAVILLIVAAILLLGQRKGALQECRSIVLSQQRDSCFANLAGSTSNATICKFISSKSDEYACILGIASAKDSIALCGYLNNTQAYEECAYTVANSTSNETACKTLEEPYRSECLYNYAKSTNFSSIGRCSDISNSTLSAECSYLYYYRRAILYKNQSYCGYLPDVVNSTVESYMLPQNSNYPLGVGMELSSLNITPRQYCYLQLANETKNSSLCSFTTGITSEICKGMFANRTANVTVNESAICSNVPSYLKDICEYSYASDEALKEDNVSQCLTISNETYKDNCIYTLAYEYNQSSYCGYILNSTAMDACYGSVK